MTASTEPVAAEPTAPAPYTYDHIPTLKEMFPTNGGLPGVTYYIVTVQKLTWARHQQNLRMIENAEPFTIKGPTGFAECIVMCDEDNPIRGQSPYGGARECWVDEAVYKATGFPDPQAPKTSQPTSNKPVHTHKPKEQ